MQEEVAYRRQPSPAHLAEAAERLLARSTPADDGSGCLRWQGNHTAGGYGQMSVGGRHYRTHAIAYFAWIGRVPAGLDIDHVYARGCRHRDCCNPQHLEAVTRRENLRRGLAARERPLYCKRGHLWSEHGVVRYKANGYRAQKCLACTRELRPGPVPRERKPDKPAGVSKVRKPRRGTPRPGPSSRVERVLLIRSLHRQGLPQRIIATQIGVSLGTVNAIVNRKSWAWVSDEPPIERPA